MPATRSASPFADARLWLALIVLLGAALRLWGLQVQSLWGDELFIQHIATLPSIREAVAVIAEDVHPPGFALLIYFTTKLLGDSEAMLRLPSALAGIAAVPTMFLLGRSWCGERVGLLAAALTAVSWFPVYYSQECRAYSFLFLSAAALGHQVGQLEQRHAESLPGVRGRAVGVCLTALVLCYLHYFGLLLVGLLGLVWFYRALRGRFPIAMLLSMSGVLLVSYLPWIATVLNQYQRGETWIRRPSLARLPTPYEAMSNGHLAALLLLLLAGAAAGTLAARARGEPLLGLRSPRARVVLLAGAWALVPTFAAFAISWLLLPVFTVRNLVILLPGLLILVALALDAIERHWLRGIALPSVLIVGLLLVDLLVVRGYYTRPTKDQFREVARHVIEANAGAAERPFVVAAVWYASYFDYYFRAFGSDLRVDVVPRLANERKVVAAKKPANLWSLEPTPKRKGKLRRYRGYREVERRSFEGWIVRKLRRK